MCWAAMDPHRIFSSVSKPSWRNTLGDAFVFVMAQFGECQITPFWSPISALHVVYLRLHVSKPMVDSGHNFRFCP